MRIAAELDLTAAVHSVYTNVDCADDSEYVLFSAFLSTFIVLSNANIRNLIP